MEDFASSSSLFSSSAAIAPQAQNVADPSPGRPYDVFLNHRGPDVKESLASIIYHWLEDRGLRVFLDNQEFQAGEELHPTIQHAIGSASVHVAIFSKSYAESSWCLNELCSMLKSGAKIIPVLYDVLPSDLRWIGKGKSVYDDAFSQHKKKGRVQLQKVDEWKEALQKIPDLYAFELNGSKFNGDQGKFLKSIVKAVSEAVAKKAPLKFGKDPVGLDEAVQEFENFIQREAQRSEQRPVKIVGIVGFGGSGKTTLAKQFYNIRRASFTASSFLSDVRHAADQQKLQSLQSKLLKDLLHITDGKIEKLSVSDGRDILENYLRSSTPRVLVVLDDIDHENQIEDLLPKEVLGSGSLILLTSRDEVALRKSGADLPYKIKPLKSDHALQLFCSYAFQQPRPKRGFEDLAEKFCDKCGGFPLFLKVMGAHLRVTGSDDKDVWHDELEFIPDDIKNLLKISYGALPREEKQMFLDVACFFIGERKAMAIRLWNISDRRAATRLKNLQRRCLVEVDDENCLKLHDHLRDFDREIAEQESPCRFWHPRQIINIRERLQRRRQIRGIITAANVEDFQNLRLNSTFEEIDLPSLKFLSIKADCFENRFVQEATNVMWLRCYDCPHTNVPARWISMKNLTVLHMLGGILEKWEVCDTQLPLKELVIKETRLSCVSIDGDIFPHLEYLDLGHNGRLVEVEHLPTKLKWLDISKCRELSKLPDLKHLTSLEMLRASDFNNLQNIGGLEHLSKLRELGVGGCSELGELPNLSGLTSLEMLYAYDCGKLQNIQGLEHLSNLRLLKIDWCFKIGQLPNLSGLTSLETLQAYRCNKLQNIQGLEHLSKLRELRLGGCSELGELPNLSGLTSLETLFANGCSKLQNIQGLEHLSKLRELNISWCFELIELPILSGLTSLETLHAYRCSKLQNMQGLEHLSKLRELNIGWCFELIELPNLSGLTSLKTLLANGCSKLQNIQGLEHLSNLERVMI